MDDAIIIYTSRTGFTQRYALWIARQLHCEVLDSKFVTHKDLSNKKIVIYGGHVFAGRVLGFKPFYRQYHQSLKQHLLVFGTGILPEQDVDVRQIMQRNMDICDAEKLFYYFQGQAKKSQLSLPHRMQLAFNHTKVEKQRTAKNGKQTVVPLIRAVEDISFGQI
ncbi:flavodoxin domain-containing protein [Lacticaseibacillus saniviri]|uniref:flavodoxin domain-containing protein n=1 Tax=Lacticaseibacillus saniviri TaxID=931533 RepID=UPI0007053598|nr:flavodoxin domain-containing protein [Lacticaseibacillus saniviri]MCG4282735.1 flavodoxin domain-containing protein [Lacticaseibacillus saniviri]